MKVIIAGSRDIRTYSEVAEAMKDCGFDVTEVVCGGAEGVDKLGQQWATRNLIPVTHFHVAWDMRVAPWNPGQWRKRAPLERNKKMGDYADALVAVWNGRSTGTAHLIGVMKNLGKPVFLREVK